MFQMVFVLDDTFEGHIIVPTTKMKMATKLMQKRKSHHPGDDDDASLLL